MRLEANSKDDQTRGDSGDAEIPVRNWGLQSIIQTREGSGAAQAPDWDPPVPEDVLLHREGMRVVRQRVQSQRQFGSSHEVEAPEDEHWIGLAFAGLDCTLEGYDDLDTWGDLSKKFTVLGLASLPHELPT